jgi:hypothetical protein
MFLLTQESTRFATLDTPINNVIFPFERLKAFLLPWSDGWPSAVKRLPATPFTGYPSISYFWDTVGYVGALPLVGLLVLAIAAILRRRAGKAVFARPWTFFLIVGSLALLIAMPPVQFLIAQIPGTILRSPARQLYLTVFVLSLSIGQVLDMLLKGRLLGKKGTLLSWHLALVGIFFHLTDLKTHDGYFIRIANLDKRDDRLLEEVKAKTADHRISVDRAYLNAINRKIDDVGFFDSAILRRPYQAVVDLSGMRASKNTQFMDGRKLSQRALSYLGVKYLFTKAKFNGTRTREIPSPIPVYRIPHPAKRAAFFPLDSARFLPRAAIHQKMRDQGDSLMGIIMLPKGARPEGAPKSPRGERLRSLDNIVQYQRQSPDLIRCTVNTEVAGYLRVLESWHDGWRAEVDGKAREILLADDFAMAVYLKPGERELTLAFETPGKWVGFAAAAISLTAMMLLIFTGLFARTEKRARRRRAG